MDLSSLKHHTTYLIKSLSYFFFFSPPFWLNLKVWFMFIFFNLTHLQKSIYQTNFSLVLQLSTEYLHQDSLQIPTTCWFPKGIWFQSLYFPCTSQTSHIVYKSLQSISLPQHSILPPMEILTIALYPTSRDYACYIYYHWCENQLRCHGQTFSSKSHFRVRCFRLYQLLHIQFPENRRWDKICVK